MLGTATEARLADFEQRLQSLEAQTPTDNLAPNYLTLNPDGSSGATFSGVISARGLTLPMGGAGSSPQNIAGWARQADGALLAQLFALRGAGDNQTTLQIQANGEVAGEPSSVLISAGGPGAPANTTPVLTLIRTPAGNPASSIAVNPGTGGTVGPKTIIDSLGRSDFAQVGNKVAAATAGAAVLPANPVGFLSMLDATGTTVKIPYYAA